MRPDINPEKCIIGEDLIIIHRSIIDQFFRFSFEKDKIHALGEYLKNFLRFNIIRLAPKL